MLAIARALAGNPELLMLDEPSQGLAPRLVRELETLMVRLKGEGVTILLVEQNARMALADQRSGAGARQGRGGLRGPYRRVSAAGGRAEGAVPFGVAGTASARVRTRSLPLP